MTSLTIVTTAPSTTLQDGGRRGHLRHGVPRSGPVDQLAHRLAARLAGREPDELLRTVALEHRGGSCTLTATTPVDLAVAGAGAELTLDGHRVPAPCVVRVPSRQAVIVHAQGWTYVVPAGDLDVPPVLGSRSHHPRSGLGPRVTDGTVLPVGPARPVVRGRWPDLDLGTGPLAVLAAPQTDWFTAAALRHLTRSGFATTHHLDRMGARLDGPRLSTRRGHDVLSDGIVPGTLQVDGDGTATVLLADHQSTGGYPKIAVLTTAALARFVRLAPGTEVRFAWTDPATARTAWQSACTRVDDLASASPRPTAVALASADLWAGGGSAGGS